MAFRESDGQFMWQAVHDKLQAGRANDWPFQGVCSSPLVENGIVYYVSNRGELMAVDLDGFRDGKNDGPVKDEKLTREVDVDILWRYDMMEELGVMQHNMANSSPVVVREPDLRQHLERPGREPRQRPRPESPAHHRRRQDDRQARVGRQLGRREDPARPVVLVGGRARSATSCRRSSARVTATSAATRPRPARSSGSSTSTRRTSVWPKTRNEVISTPIIVDNVVYIANGQDPEHGEGVGHLYAIDGTKRGDITKSGQLWHYGDIRRSISTGALFNGILFYSDFSGFLHALDAKTGKQLWKHDMFAAIWGSPIVIDGKVFLGDEDGDVTILNADRAMKVVAENNMGSSVYSTRSPPTARSSSSTATSWSRSRRASSQRQRR